jgi:mannose-6-phosphate isomerase-like protein (cupin superfamily)
VTAGPEQPRGSGGRPPGGQLFPAATAVTNLAVYDWTGPDGLTGGSAHVHLACTEGYVVMAGSGRLQTLSSEGFAETPLTPMTVAWFSPGVVHRLINDGGLEILVVMQNAGLPEAGDTVLTFPPEKLTEASTYRAAASLSGAASAAEAAQRRAQLAVDGFLQLRDQVLEQGPGALDAFYASAAALVSDLIPDWRATWEEGPLAAAQRTGEHLDLLSKGSDAHLRQGRLTVLARPPEREYGVCGRRLTFPSSA